jgi:hypothetical protein
MKDSRIGLDIAPSLPGAWYWLQSNPEHVVLPLLLTSFWYVLQGKTILIPDDIDFGKKYLDNAKFDDRYHVLSFTCAVVCC